MERCPVSSLINFIKTPGAKVPQELLDHAKTCEKCGEVLSRPEEWDSFLSIYESLSNPFNNETEIKEGAVCRLKIKDSSNSAFVLVTDTSSMEKDGYIRVSPIVVSPHEDDVDEETDIIIPPSKMPTGLPSLVEWWNDRPVLASSINRIFGNLDTDNYSIIKDKITNQPKISKPTKSVMMFREIERRKGNLMSASFFENFFE